MVHSVALISYVICMFKSSILVCEGGVHRGKEADPLFNILIPFPLMVIHVLSLLRLFHKYSHNYSSKKV